MHPSELYLARADEVNVLRPIMQGDVFPNVEIPGVDDDKESGNLAIVLAHPCSMRRGHQVVDRLRMARLRRRDKFPLKKWSQGHYNVMPLPELRGERDEEFFVAVFEEAGRVLTKHLDVETRLACLSWNGLMLMQQRMVFSDTRVVVDTGTLLERSAPVLTEAELLEEWNEETIDASSGTDLVAELDQQAKAFDDLLSVEQKGDEGESFTLRERLRVPVHHSTVRIAVRKEMARSSGR